MLRPVRGSQLQRSGRRGCSEPVIGGSAGSSLCSRHVCAGERRMKLLTHNMLRSHVTGVTRGFPLVIRAEEVKVNSVEFNREFVSRMIPKLEWEALVETAESLGHGSGLPRELLSGYENDEEFLKKVHHVLLEVEIIEGALKCPESGTEFPITRGIPNMLINEEES